jgi:hypothetical protein
MGLSTIIPSIIFGLTGLFIIAFTLKLFVTALLGNPWNWYEQQKVMKKERLLSEGDLFFEKDNYDRAVSIWKSAFYLDRLNHLPSLIDKVHNLNINALGRLLNLSEKRRAHIGNLPVIEELIGSRTELMHLYFETALTLKKLRVKKNEASGKSSPNWALQEFSKKHTEIKQKIDANRTQLEAELKKCFESLSRPPANEGITYH